MALASLDRSRDFPASSGRPLGPPVHRQFIARLVLPQKHLDQLSLVPLLHHEELCIYTLDNYAL